MDLRLMEARSLDRLDRSRMITAEKPSLDDVYHHGVKGMKWGVLNGPPYPIDGEGHPVKAKVAGKLTTIANNVKGKTAAGVKVAERKKVVKRTDDADENKKEDEEKKGLTDKQKKALKIGAAVAVAAIAGYGAYRYYQATDPKNSPLYDKEAGFLRLEKPMSLEENVLQVNYGAGSLEGRSNNCMDCTVALALREKGFDVAAGSSTFGHDIDDLQVAFPMSQNKVFNPDVVAPKQSMSATSPTSWANFLDPFRPDSQRQTALAQAMEREMLSQGEGAYGCVSVMWAGGGGHAIFYKVENGKAILADGQIGKTYSIHDIAKQLSVDGARPSYVTRLDNAEPNFKVLKAKEGYRRSKGALMVKSAATAAKKTLSGEDVDTNQVIMDTFKDYVVPTIHSKRKFVPPSNTRASSKANPSIDVPSNVIPITV